MSVATEFAPVVYIPSRARQPEYRGATIVSLLPPSEQSIAAPLRLTRRGVLVMASAVAVLAAALIGLAWLSAPSSQAAVRVPATVAVREGDTLWSIASRVAPNRDPRAEIADLQRINHFTGVDLIAGEVLRTR
jgi:hypothetical protein